MKHQHYMINANWRSFKSGLSTFMAFVVVAEFQSPKFFCSMPLQSFELQKMVYKYLTK